MTQADDKTVLPGTPADLAARAQPAADSVGTNSATAPAAAVSDARLTRWPHARRLWSALKAAFAPPDNPAVMPGMEAFERSVEHVMSHQSTRRAQIGRAHV